LLIYLEIIKHAVDIQSVAGLVKVAVLLDLHARVTKDRDMVTPCRVGDIDLLGMRIESAQEGGTNTKSTSS
jgi:hypothetical protein